MTVLVAVADDALRQRVLDVGVDLARALGTDISVVHLTADEYADAEARAVRDEVRESLADSDVSFSVSIEHVDGLGRSSRAVGRQLAELADDVTVSHVVIGHTARSVVSRLVGGSTAFELADGASVPVTVVPSEDPD